MPLQAWNLSEAILFLPCRNKYAFCGVLESGFCLWECVVSDVHLLKGYHTHTLTKTSTFWGCYCRLDVYNLRSISKMYCYDQTGCQDKAFQKHSGNECRRESNEEVIQLDATSSSTFWQIKNVRHEHDATSLLICLPSRTLVFQHKHSGNLDRLAWLLSIMQLYCQQAGCFRWAIFEIVVDSCTTGGHKGRSCNI